VTNEDLTISREREFWDEHVPDLGHCLAVYERGPSPSVRGVLQAIAPLAGKRVLDFACGPGVLSAWLAARGAEVTGVDISPGSVARARELAGRLGLAATFTTAALDDLPEESFDAAVGEYALHHVDLETVAPRLLRLLRPGAPAAFVETMALNPLLNFARAHLTGRGVVAQWGTDDEHPISARDLEMLRATFGSLRLETRQMQFLRLLDRNILRARVPVASRMLALADDWMLAQGWGRLSYCQVVTVQRSS